VSNCPTFAQAIEAVQNGQSLHSCQQNQKLMLNFGYASSQKTPSGRPWEEYSGIRKRKMAKKAKHTREFRGKTEWDIESQFSRWQQANAGLMLSIKRHPIERLPLPVQRPGFERRPVKIADAFSMLVEYETKTHDRARAR
jgi:hypothetical protein